MSSINVTTQRCCGFAAGCNKKDTCKFSHPNVCGYYLVGKCSNGNKCRLPHPEIKDNSFTFDNVVYTVHIPKPAKVFEAKVEKSASSVPRPTHHPKPFNRGPKKPVTEDEVNRAISKALVDNEPKPLVSIDKRLSNSIESRAKFMAQLAREQAQLAREQAAAAREQAAEELLLKRAKTASAKIDDYESLLANSTDSSDAVSEPSEEPSDAKSAAVPEPSVEPSTSWADDS